MSEKGLSPEDAATYYQIERATQPPKDRILIIGGRDSNWDADLRKHPDLVFWDSTDPDTHRKQAVPYRVGCVILMEFISHGDTNRLNKISPPGMKVLGPFPTGRVKRILRPFLAARAATREVTKEAAPAVRGEPETPAETELGPRAREKIAPARMMASPAILEPIVAAIVAVADNDGIVSGQAVSQVVIRLTGAETTARHIKVLARGGYLNPTKSPEGKRFSRYRVMEKARETAHHYEERTAPPKASDLLGQQLEDLSRRVAALEAERETLFRRLLPLGEEFVRLLTEALVKK